MASLKDLRSRIASVKSTRKITSAMKMVAASKLRRAQDAAEAARPYAERMGTMLGRLAAAVGSNEGAPKLLAGSGKDNVHLLVVFTADRGLCGGFNASIVKAARLKAKALQAEGKTVKLICVGRKGADALKREFGDSIVARYTGIEGKKGIDFSSASEVGDKVLALYDEGEFDVCTIFYNSSCPRFRRWQQHSSSSRLSVKKLLSRKKLLVLLRFMITNRPKKPFWLICCRVTLASRFSVQCLKAAHPSTARVCPRWITQPAMPAT